MGSLEKRLRGLETSLASDLCPVCSLVSDEVVWEDIDGPEDLGEGDEEPTYCEGCGRQLEYVVVWDDLIHNERKE